MSPETKTNRPPLVTQQSSLSSLSASSSYAASFAGMERAIPSFQTFVKSAAPIISQKQLPPQPRKRRASSVYNRNVTSIFESADLPLRAPSTEFVLQQITFSQSTPHLVDEPATTPIFLDAKIYTSPSSLAATSKSSSQTNLLPKLAPTTYTRIPSPKSARTKPQPSPSLPSPLLNQAISTGYINLPPPEIYRQTLYTPPADVFAESAPNSPEYPLFSTDLESLAVPLLPHEVTSNIPAHTRQVSSDEALVSLGLDPETLLLESEHQKNYHGERNVNFHTASMRTKSFSSHSISQSSSISLLSGDATLEEEKTEAQLFAEDYGKVLTDQYRAEQARKNSADSTKAEMRLVPAPLFFQKRRKDRRQNMSNGQIKTTTSPAPKVKLPIRIPNLLHRDKRRSSTSNHSHIPTPTSSTTTGSSTKGISPISKFPPSRTAPTTPTLPRNHLPSPSPSPGTSIPTQSPSASATSIKPTLTSTPRKPFLHELRTHLTTNPSSSTASSRLPARAKLPKNPFAKPSTTDQNKAPVRPLRATARPAASPSHIQKLTSALEKAKAELAERVRMPDMGAFGAGFGGGGGGAETEAGGRRRREELKASIRLVGEVDPMSVEVEERGAEEDGMVDSGDAGRDYRGWSRRV